MNVLIAGDFCQRYRVDNIVRNRQFGILFDEVKPIISAADYSIVNFEFPIVLNPEVAKPIPKCGANLGGTMESIDAIKYVGFSCCTLANNHILDQGEQCCLDTRNELEQADVDTVGVGRNLEDAGRILYKEIDGKVLAIINCCEHEFSIATSISAGANPLNPILQYYKIQEARKNATYVLVIVHGGFEHYQLPSPRMQETYRFFIDAGADAVVNHHQHCYSGYEVYKNKPIFYGLGNFCFDIFPEQKNTIWNYGYMLQLDFNNSEIAYRLYPYYQCGEITSVSLLAPESLDESISKINAIISNQQELYAATDSYYSQQDLLYATLVEPIRNKYLQALQIRKKIPLFSRRSSLLKMHNYILCESHREKLIHFFQSKIKSI